MKVAAGACRAVLQRVLKILGLSAAGVGVMTVATDSQVFASLFLKDAMAVTDPTMEYSPRLQLMVTPGTDDPVFQYSTKRGKENGEYKVAPLETKVTKPPPPPPPPPKRPPPTVAQGSGPYGQGPHPD